MDKKNLVKTIFDFLSGNKPELLEEIKKIDLAETPAPTQSNTVKTQDGSLTISYDGELAINTPVFTVDETGTKQPVMDGEYQLEDGSVISVVGGIVAEISTPQEESGEMEMKKELETKMSAQKKELEKDFEVKLSEIKEAQRLELNALKKQLEVLVNFAKEVANVPQAEEKKVLTNEEFDKLSPYAKYKLSQDV